MCRKTRNYAGWSFYCFVQKIRFSLFLSDRCDTDKYKLYKFTFMNVTQVPRKVDHNTDLKVYPVANYDFYDEDQEIPAIRQCKKGSIRSLPYCVPGEFIIFFK